MSWITPDARTLSQVFALNPSQQQGLARFSAGIWTQPYIPATTLELCRLRIARLLQCAPELLHRQPEAVAMGLSEQKIARLQHYGDDPQFSQAERACLEFTEVYCQDPQAITDDLAAAVVDHYGDEGLVLLVQALGLFNGLARMSVLLDIQVAEVDHGA
jgi:alkylhydroperoxidase family enzyme